MTIDDFISYANSYDPDFSSRISGATPSEIDVLEQLAGHRLPTMYRTFLERMGKRDGGLRIGNESTTNIDKLIEFYKDVTDDEVEVLPKDCIVIAQIGVGTFELSLRLVDQTEPPVVFTSGTTIVGPCAESLAKLLYRKAFQRFRMSRIAERAYLTAPRTEVSFESVTGLANEIGLSKEWFSDEVVYCGSRDDTLVAVSVLLHHPISIEIASLTGYTVDQLAGIFQHRLGMSLQWRIPRDLPQAT